MTCGGVTRKSAIKQEAYTYRFYAPLKMSLVLFLSLYRSTLCKKMVGRGSRLNQTELFSRSKAMGILIVLFLFLSGCKQYDKTDATVMKLYQDNEEHFVKAATLLTTYLDDSSIHIFKDDTGAYSRCYIRSFDYFHVATASDSTLSEKEYLSLDEALSPLFCREDYNRSIGSRSIFSLPLIKLLGKMSIWYILWMAPV